MIESKLKITEETEISYEMEEFKKLINVSSDLELLSVERTYLRHICDDKKCKHVPQKDKVFIKLRKITEK